MKIKLNLIDNQGRNYKTLETESVTLKTGVIKRIYKIMDVDSMIEECDTTDKLYQAILSRMMGMYNVFEDVILEIFPDLTAEELDNNTTPDEIANIILSLIIITMTKLSSIGAKLKNLLRTEPTT